MCVILIHSPNDKYFKGASEKESAKAKKHWKISWVLKDG